MTKQASDIHPTEISLHSKSRVLSITFSDGKQFNLPCEYLRVHSHAAEVRASGRPESGKENVNIDRIEPQGSYALRLVFDDGHDTGIYSWETLYDLGANYDRYWQEYLDRLEAAGLTRRSGDATERPRTRQAVVEERLRTPPTSSGARVEPLSVPRNRPCSHGPGGRNRPIRKKKSAPLGERFLSYPGLAT